MGRDRITWLTQNLLHSLYHSSFRSKDQSSWLVCGLPCKNSPVQSPGGNLKSLFSTPFLSLYLRVPLSSL